MEIWKDKAQESLMCFPGKAQDLSKSATFCQTLSVFDNDHIIHVGCLGSKPWKNMLQFQLNTVGRRKTSGILHTGTHCFFVGSIV